jgi:hypothetical protein
MEEFNNRPYMNYEYPELMKHYPGTWRLATKNQLKGIVVRLTTNPAPTSASMMCRRRIQSAPVGRPILKDQRTERLELATVGLQTEDSTATKLI